MKAEKEAAIEEREKFWEDKVEELFSLIKDMEQALLAQGQEQRVVEPAIRKSVQLIRTAL